MYAKLMRSQIPNEMCLLQVIDLRGFSYTKIFPHEIGVMPSFTKLNIYEIIFLQYLFAADASWVITLLIILIAGYGFVDFESPQAANQAVKALRAKGYQAQMAKVGVSKLLILSGTYQFYALWHVDLLNTAAHAFIIALLEQFVGWQCIHCV
jgi:hypothetical protein